jgi:integrase
VASVFARGPRSAPRFFARYRDERKGWRAVRVRVARRVDALKIARHLEARAELVRFGLAPGESAITRMDDLLKRFVEQLTNRAGSTDETRVSLHVLPKWRSYLVEDVTVGEVRKWIAELKNGTAPRLAERRPTKRRRPGRQRVAGPLAPSTQRAVLSLLSRAFSWAIGEELIRRDNPVKLGPTGLRPSAKPLRKARVIDDEETPREIMAALPRPADLIFYVCFTSGCRVSEALGLRLSDLDELGTGRFRIAHSGDGPIKEARGTREEALAAGKDKRVPAAEDAIEVLGPWIAQRRAAGAGADALVFPGEDGRLIKRHVLAYAWTKARRALGLTGMSWHNATRTSACSRWASQNVPIEQIARALGHASIATTIGSYQKWQQFDPVMRTSFRRQPPGGNVTPIGAARAPAPGAAAVVDVGTPRAAGRARRHG